MDNESFANDAAYGNSKDLAKGNISDKILKDRAYEVALNPKYDEYQRGLASMMYKFFDKKIRSRNTSKKRANLNEVLSQELYKPVIKNSKAVKHLLCVMFPKNMHGLGP